MTYTCMSFPTGPLDPATSSTLHAFSDWTLRIRHRLLPCMSSLTGPLAFWCFGDTLHIFSDWAPKIRRCPLLCMSPLLGPWNRRRHDLLLCMSSPTGPLGLCVLVTVHISSPTVLLGSGDTLYFTCFLGLVPSDPALS